MATSLPVNESPDVVYWAGCWEDRVTDVQQGPGHWNTNVSVFMGICIRICSPADKPDSFLLLQLVINFLPITPAFKQQLGIYSYNLNNIWSGTPRPEKTSRKRTEALFCTDAGAGRALGFIHQSLLSAPGCFCPGRWILGCSGEAPSNSALLPLLTVTWEVTFPPYLADLPFLGCPLPASLC